MIDTMSAGSQASSIQLQERDHALLCDLFESRIMTLEHVTLLHFDGRSEAAKKRVQKLKAAGFIAERPRRPTEPSILHLTRKGFKLLLADGLLDRYPRLGVAEFERRAKVSETTIRHELDVMSVKAAMVAAIRKTDRFTVAEFGTWPRLYEFRSRPPARNGSYSSEVLIRPDGFIRVHEKEPDGGLSEHVFFLEVDRSTEAQDRLAAKATCYVNHYKTGAFAVKMGGSREEVEQYPFRVLMVFKTEERRDNTAHRLLECHPPILTQVWLATFEKVIDRPLEDIWIHPAECRRASAGSVSSNRLLTAL